MPKKKHLLPAPVCLKVNERRNSECDTGFPLSKIDWSHWWTDTGFSGTVLYLKLNSLDGESTQRVYCRYSDTPRLTWKNGVLYWLISKQERMGGKPHA